MEKYGEDRVFNTPLCEQVNYPNAEIFFYSNFRVSLVLVLDAPWLALVQLLKFNLLIISSQHSIRLFQGQLTHVLTFSFRLSMKQLNIDIEVVPSSIVAV